ncbi:MAG: nucleotidyltransferase domain-containing protein [Nanoarchaeota archaeon]
MLDNINKLSVFFEDCYKEFGVRQYAKINKISPPAASNFLKVCAKEGLLNMRKDRGYLLFKTNRESIEMRDLSRIYWNRELKIVKEKIDAECHPKAIILFGSLSKLEAKNESDIDIALMSAVNKVPDLKAEIEKLKREIHIFSFDSLSSAPKKLRSNLVNGYRIYGEIE